MSIQPLGDYGHQDESAFTLGPPDDVREPGIYSVSEHFVEIKTPTGIYKVTKACPHRGAPLDVYGRLDPDTCVLTCSHKGFAWDVTTGAYRGRVPNAAADLDVISVTGGAA